MTLSFYDGAFDSTVRLGSMNRFLADMSSAFESWDTQSADLPTHVLYLSLTYFFLPDDFIG
jgi:hypothetical protein